MRSCGGHAGWAPVRSLMRPCRRIAIVAERRHLDNRSLRETRTALANAGCEVVLVVPGADRLFEIPRERPDWDAILSRGRDLGGLGLLSAASALGVLAINSPQAIELVRNKIAMQAVLHEHGIPLPRTWFATDSAVFRAVPRDRFPLVVKPFDGDGSQGLALLDSPDDIDLLPPISGRRALYLAQEFLVTDGTDLKLYGIGSDVWAVRKPSPVSFPEPGPAHFTPVEGGELVPLTPELRDIGLTCGRACGLELWGVDVALTPNGPTVIEVNDFPTYSAVPGAGQAIAEHVLRRVEMSIVAREVGSERTFAIIRGAL